MTECDKFGGRVFDSSPDKSSLIWKMVFSSPNQRRVFGSLLKSWSMSNGPALLKARSNNNALQKSTSSHFDSDKFTRAEERRMWVKNLKKGATKTDFSTRRKKRSQSGQKHPGATSFLQLAKCGNACTGSSSHWKDKAKEFQRRQK